MDEKQKFASDLVFLTNKALTLGLYRTAQRMTDASRELGWELAGVPLPPSQQLYSDVADKDRR